MRREIGRLAAICAALGSLLASGATAEPYAVGDRMSPMTFETQFGETVVVGSSTRLILITHDMDAGGIAKTVLADHTAASLEGRGAVYVADVSRMPGLVSRFVAIPRMRLRPYPVALDRESVTADLFPGVQGAVTAVWLEGGRITRIEQLTAEEAVRASLTPPGESAPDSPS